MKKILLSFLFLLLINRLTGQGKMPDLKDVTLQDLQLKACPFETDAPAMKMAEMEMTNFEVFGYNENTRIKIEKRIRIKIFNEKGYKYASIKIPYFSKKGVGKIKELSGTVYNLDEAGNMVIQRLDKDDFFKEKTTENIGVVNFTFPNIRSGSIIEYCYVRIEKDFYQFEPWIIQDKIPTLYTSAIFTFPVSSLFKESFFGTETVSMKTELFRGGQMKRIIYTKESVPSFKAEPFMSSFNDYLMRAIFFHMPNSGFFGRMLTAEKTVWKNAGNYLLKSPFFGGQIDIQIPGTESLIDSAKKIDSIPERIKFIYEAVRKRIPDKTEQTLYPEDILEAWNSHSGNTAEINMILLNLLIKSDIRSHPLLISTRENGKVKKDFPSFSQLNGMDILTIIDSTRYYILDGSLKFHSVKNPPLNILNREVLLLNPDNIGWFMIEDKRALLKQNMTIFCDLDSNGLIAGQAAVQHYHYAKSYALDTTIEDDDNKEGKFSDKKFPGLKIISVKREETHNDDDPLFETVEFTYEPQTSDKFYFIYPQFLSPSKLNTFTADERKTDIDMGCNQEYIMSMSISFPDIYEVDHLPKNIIVRAPDSSFYFKRSSSSTGSTIYFSQIFEIKRALFDKEEYPGILEFFKRIYALMAEEIILKKKK